MIKDRSGNTRMIPIVNNEAQKGSSSQPQQTTPKRQENVAQARPRRTGGVSIVFRKVSSKKLSVCLVKIYNFVVNDIQMFNKSALLSRI